MKLTPTSTIEAPDGFVFDALLDFANPRADLPQNAEVKRTDDLSEPGPGMSWRIILDLRGRRREIELELVDCTRPERMIFEGASPGLSIYCTAVLTVPEPRTTRIDFDLDLKPQNLASRMLVHSLKLAKYQITRRLENRLRVFFATIEARARSET